MKNSKRLVFFIFLLTALCSALLLNSCNKEKLWNDHYQQLDPRLKDNMLTILKADPDLSTFVDLLQQTGYDSVLTYSQAYTIWAPVNAAFTSVSQDTLGNMALLKVLVGNHLSRFSFSTADVSDAIKVKMFNGKYNSFTNTSGSFKFGGATITESDLLSNNGILHKISSVVRVRPNIWEYMRNSLRFPSAMSYLNQFNIQVFDVYSSIRTGINTLGKPVYDSVFTYSSTYFKKVGDLNSEENQFTYIGLSDKGYNSAYKYFKDYYKFPVQDTVDRNTYTAIFNNLAFPAISKQNLPNDYLTNTFGNKIKIAASSINEDLGLSNGYLFAVDTLTSSASDIIYKPVTYEVEDIRRRTIGATSAMTITKIYDLTASGNFNNKVEYILTTAPTTSNNYFEVRFSNVLSAKYDVYVKFSPIGALKDTKLTFRLVYSNFTTGTTTVNIPDKVISRTETGAVKIGTTSTFPVYINSNTTNTYFVSFRIMLSVTNAELVLYDRKYGIDYIQLVPVP